MPPSRPRGRWNKIGAGWAGVLQALKAAAILGLIVALIHLLSH